MYRKHLSRFVLGLAAALLAGAGAASALELETAVSDRTKLVFATHAGDGSGRLFLVNQEGIIDISRDGAVLPTPFLDISGPVTCCGERGMLGLAFAPDYETTGRFYVNYTATVQGQLITRVSRFTASPANADVADANSEQVIIEFDQPASNHNAGWMDFGQDGYLYIATGDGGSGGDPWSASGNAQDKNVLLGKMLRLDVSGSGPSYSIPPTNPFFGMANRRAEIWSYGLRNPWRNSFDRATGDLYIGDVGQGDIEEISVQPGASDGGENYGWRVMEGNACFDPAQQGGNPPCNDASFTPPIHTYDHSGNRCAVTGGYVYRGDAMPRSRGLYFFADYCSRNVYSLKYVPGLGATEVSDRTAELDPLGPLTSFGEDERGELLIVTPTDVYRVVDPVAESVRSAVLPSFAEATGANNTATLAELQQAGVIIVQSLFDELDANNNDELTLAELLNVAGIGELHHADINLDNAIDLTELLRVIQLYNALRYSCASNTTEDGFQPGPGDLTCARHSADYQSPQGSLSLSELLRMIQFYNTGALTWCPDSDTEDGFCPAAAG